MIRWALWLLPISIIAAPARYARLGDFDGTVEVQLNAADDWQAALRNMPIGELAWLRTGDASRAELELDDGSVLRLSANSQAELSDYTRLSTGQRITLISLDHGLAYFSGVPEGNDALMLAVPGAQVTLRQGARLRIEARDTWSQIAAGAGKARFSSPTAEFDLNEGQMLRLDPAHPSRFSLNPEVPSLDSDRWSDERDQVLASTASSAHVAGLRYGAADLDAGGTWIQAGDLGAVWKPRVAAAWAPFRNGKWQWYEGLGYTWISADSWGWLPYHYGRWMQLPETGWVWTPGKSTVFKPGEVYWLKSAKLVGWGPLAPGEAWKPPDLPLLFLNANTTYAPFAADALEIDPAGFAARPKEPLAVAVFALALPSPAFLASRLDAVRPVLRAGSTRVVPALEGVTFEGAPEPPEPRRPEPPPVLYSSQPAEQPVVIVNNPHAEDQPPAEVYIPVYTGIIVVNPPARKAQTAIAGQAKPVPAGNQTPPAGKPREPARPKPEDKDKSAK